MSTEQISNLIDFQRARCERLYGETPPIDPNLASLCLRDQLWDVELAGDGLGVTGECRLANKCAYVKNKLGDITGFCLKVSAEVDRHQA